MSVPSDSVAAKYHLAVYSESSPYVEFSVQVEAGLNWTTPDQETLDGFLRAGMQAIVDAVKAEYPTGVTVQATVTYDRETAGTPVTPTP